MSWGMGIGTALSFADAGGNGRKACAGSGLAGFEDGARRCAFGRVEMGGEFKTSL